MGVAVKIPGADSIDVPAPARDPGVQATPDEFGANIGASMEHVGAAVTELGAHLYRRRQDANDKVAASAFQVDYAVNSQKALIDARTRNPNGGDALTADLATGLQSAKDQSLEALRSRGVEPSDRAMGTINTHAAGVSADYLSRSVAMGHNIKIQGLQATLDDSSKSATSQVLSGAANLEEGLRQVDELKKAGVGLYNGPDLEAQSTKWRQSVIDAAIRNRYNAGDKPGGDALSQKYYGAVPKYGDANAGIVVDSANRLGIEPRNLAAVISYETGGRFDPNAIGGKGNNYQGLIQFGPEERAKYGVKPGQTFAEQMPAVEAYLRDRGLKPGMGLAELYSIVNAGSLDKNGRPRWTASDGNGDITSHVQRIESEHYASADRFLGGAGSGIKVASADGGAGLPNADASGDTAVGSSGTAAPLLPDPEKALYWRQQSHAVDVDQRQAQQRQEAATQAASDNRELEVFKDIHSDAPMLTAQQILNDPTLTKDAKEKLFNAKTSLVGGEKVDKTYGRAFYALYRKVHAADNDPNRITDPKALYAHVGPYGDLTIAGVDKLVAEIQGRRTPEGVAEGEMKNQFFKMAKAQISGSDEGLHLHDPKGDELYLKFMAQALPAYDAGKKSGKSATQLLNPDSPDYIGKSIGQFKRPMDQWFSDVVRDSPVVRGEPAKAFDAGAVKSLDELREAYFAGKVTRDLAGRIALSRGWATAANSGRPGQPSVPVSR